MSDGRVASAICLDCGSSLSEEEFAAARDYAFRLARARVLYGARYDYMALFALGSEVTKNEFADGAADDGGDNLKRYKGIELASKARKPGIDFLWAVKTREKGSAKVDYLGTLDVAAEHVLVMGKRMSRRRVYIISNGKGRIESNQEKSIEELQYFLELALKHNIEVTVVLVDGLRLADLPGGTEEDPDLTDDESEESDDDGEDSAAASDGERESNEGAEEKADEKGDPCDEDAQEEVSAEVKAAIRRAKRLFAPSRINASFERRKELHESAKENRHDHVVPKDSTLLRQTLLCRLARALNSRGVSLAVALEELVHLQKVKDTNSSVKFHGLFEIGRTLKIPIRIYSRSVVKSRPSGKKVVWTDSVAQKMPVGILREETLKAVNDMEGDNIDALEVSKAYPYGDSLLRLDGVDAYGLVGYYEPQLRLICFVPQDRVPPEIFLDSVDVVLPMAGTPGAAPHKMLSALTMALHEHQCGIAARFVSARGTVAAPQFVYLWPGRRSCGGFSSDNADEEQDTQAGDQAAATKPTTDEENDEVSYFLNMAKIPTREEVRRYPFASLRKYKKNVLSEEQSAMDMFVEAMDLEADAPFGVSVSDVSQAREQVPSSSPAGEEDDFEPFDPSEYCNPALERFFFTVINRVLEGGEGTSGVAPPSAWAKKLMTPKSFIRPKNRSMAARAFGEIKNRFPLQMIKEVDPRKGQSHVEIATGIERDIAHLFPNDDEEVDEERGISEESDDIFEFGQPARGRNVADSNGSRNDEVISYVSDCPDRLSDRTPVVDMRAMVRAGRQDEAFEYMGTYIPVRLSERNFEMALECLAGLRAVCHDLKKVDPFHRCLEMLASKARSSNPDTSRPVVDFIERVSVDGRLPEALTILRPHTEEAMRRMKPNASTLRVIQDSLGKFAGGAKKAALSDNTSELTRLK